MVRPSLVALLMLCGTASAQMPGMAAAPANPATAAYQASTRDMMKGMDQPYSGDADRDFVTHMLPHHEAAVDMARVELRSGRDPALRKLARAIIAAQTKEQVFMRHWLQQHPPR